MCAVTHKRHEPIEVCGQSVSGESDVMMVCLHSSRRLATILLCFQAVWWMACPATGLDAGCLRSGGVDPTLQVPAQEQAQQLQEEIACANQPGRETFEQEIRERHGITGKA